MSTLGPVEERQLRDSAGGVYALKAVIGKGATGETYSATIIKPPKGNHTLKVGETVAIKKQYPPDTKLEAEAQSRELHNVQRAGMLLGVKYPDPKDSDQNLYIVQPLYPGRNLTNTLNEVTETGPGQKKILTPEEKENLALGILYDYYALHLSGIVHADLKPDNILVDLKSGTVKIIDMGECFVASEGSPHDKFSAPGPHYSPPESYGPNGPLTKNSFKTDLYNIGIMIASIYSDCNYANVPLPPWDHPNAAMFMREQMPDILDPGVTQKDGMSDALLRIVRDLTTVDPNARPDNIALAQGVKTHPKLQAIRDTQKELAKFKNRKLQSEIEKILLTKGISREFKNELTTIFLINQDLPTMRVQLEALGKKYPEEKAAEKLKPLCKNIDAFCINQAKKIQALRVNMLQEHSKKEKHDTYQVIVDSIIRDLEKKCWNHKKGHGHEHSRKRATVFSQETANPSQLNDIGKLFYFASKSISDAKSDPAKVEEILNFLRKQIAKIPDKHFDKLEVKDKILDDVKTFQDLHKTTKPDVTAKHEKRSSKRSH